MYHHRVLETIQHCGAMCEFTEFSILQMEGSSHRREQLRLLRDCADICTLTAKYIARCSYFTKSIASLCAQICEVCGNHCLQYPDKLSQRCGQICLRCAQECRVLVLDVINAYPFAQIWENLGIFKLKKMNHTIWYFLCVGFAIVIYGFQYIIEKSIRKASSPVAENGRINE
jgi:hypothetical protein